MKSIIQAVVPRPRDDGGSVLRDVLAGEDYDLSETDSSGVNALWIVSTQFCDTSLAEAEALLNAARGFVLTENSFRMLVYCHQVDGQLSTSSSEGDGRHRFVDSAGAHANLWQNFNFPAYSEDDLRRPAWRWAMSGEVAKKAASELGLAVNMGSSRQAPAGTLASHTADSNPTVSTETEQPTCDWTLFVVGADGLMLVPVSVDHRHLLALADTAPYSRRMVFSGLWIACRAGNQALLDLMLRAGTPWAAAVRRAFTLEGSCDDDDDDAEDPFESKGEFVQGEVWREMDLPQRFNSCGQAALMSANVGLVKALEAHVGRDAFWANCRSEDASDFHDSVAHYAGKFDALGLLTRKRMPSEGDSSEPSAKCQATAGTADHELSPESRRLYGWGMAQAIATHVFIRESEEPLAGSITTSVRYARGDSKCKDQDLHGPRVFERSIDVLKLIDARARDDPVVTELLREPSIINLMYRFASPFYYAVESGNQAAFAYISAQLAEVVDANFDVDQTKLGTNHPVKASELVKGFFAELDIIQGGTRSGAIRSPLWYGVLAQYRYGKAPDWGGARSADGGPHGGGPDPNAFPREFNKELWYHEVVLELVRCVSLLHPHLGLRDGENPVPGPLRETMCQEKDAWFPAVQTWLSSQRPVCARASSQSFWKTFFLRLWCRPVCARASSQSFWESFFLRLWCRHGFLGIKQLALVGSGSKFEIDWDLFLKLVREEPLELDVVAPPLSDEQTAAIRAELECNDEDVQLDAMVCLRKKLSGMDNDPPIDSVIDAGLITVVLPFCRVGAGQSETIQVEALWVLTNIAEGSTPQAGAIVDAGAVPVFVECLGSPHEQVLSQAVWALGNIAGDNARFRDAVIDAGFVPALIKILRTDTEWDDRQSVRRTACWAMQNLTRGRPQPHLDAVRDVIPVIAEVLSVDGDDFEMCRDCLWALTYLIDGTDDRIQAVTDVEGLVARVVQLMTEDALQMGALRTIGNIASAEDPSVCQAVIDAGALPVIKMKLDSADNKICKQAYWTLSNITAGTVAQIQSFLDEDLLHFISSAVLSDPDKPSFVMQEAITTLCNIIHNGSAKQLGLFIQEQGVAALVACARGDILRPDTLNAISALVQKVEESGESTLAAELREKLSRERLESEEFFDDEEFEGARSFLLAEQ